jgi:hypothetical protein
MPVVTYWIVLIAIVTKMAALSAFTTGIGGHPTQAWPIVSRMNRI